MISGCPHCAAAHSQDPARCPSTGLPIGGDPKLVGSTLAGRYSLVRLLGDGGMGAVYKAADLVLRRFVAVKLLHPALNSDPDLVERFQREARSAAAVGHPNIIEVLDFGETGGAPFMVMEYLRGRSLASLLETEGPLPVARACAMATHALAGLASAHDRNIIHRDLKPANLMIVSRLGDTDFIKVCDFGFATFIGPAVRADREITPEKTFVGTPSYVAPEKWAVGECRDPTVDLYALGVVLYESLAGRRPFEAATMRSLAHMIRSEPPAPIRRYRPAVPQALAAVIERALEKRPESRWPDAAAFAEALVPFGGREVRPEAPEEDEDESNPFVLEFAKIRAREGRRAADSQIAGSIELSINEVVLFDDEPPTQGLGRRCPPPASAPQTEVSVERSFDGTVIQAIFRFLDQRFGEDARTAFIRGLPGDLQESLGRSGRPGSWIPNEDVRQLMEQIDKRLGADDLRLVAECGRALGDGIYDLARHLEPVATTIAVHLEALPVLGRRLVRGVEYVLRRIGDGHGRIELIDPTDRPSLTGCVATLGFIERSLQRAGAREVEVNLISCRSLADSRCMFDVTWLSAQP